jgi:hypothetical protein
VTLGTTLRVKVCVKCDPRRDTKGHGPRTVTSNAEPSLLNCYSNPDIFNSCPDQNESVWFWSAPLMPASFSSFLVLKLVSNNHKRPPGKKKKTRTRTNLNTFSFCNARKSSSVVAEHKLLGGELSAKFLMTLPGSLLYKNHTYFIEAFNNVWVMSLPSTTYQSCLYLQRRMSHVSYIRVMAPIYESCLNNLLFLSSSSSPPSPHALSVGPRIDQSLLSVQGLIPWDWSLDGGGSSIQTHTHT